MKEYLISVRLMTYNHVNYIAKAIESVLMQKTNFNVELVIGDDFSTDGTMDILEKYQSTPNVDIKILNRKIGDKYWTMRQEKGRLYNYVNIIDNCIGKYIALLDGDDYWIDPNKLQIQIDFLENNPEYGLSHTDCNFLYQNEGRIENAINKNVTLNNKMHDNQNLFEYLLINKYRIRTASVVMRSDLLQKINSYPDNIFISSNFPMGDTPKWLELSRISKFHYIDKPMVVYRLSENSACRPIDAIKDQLFRLRAIELRMYFISKYNISKRIRRKIKYKFRRKLTRLILSGYQFKLIIPKREYESFLFNSFIFMVKLNITKRVFRKFIINKI